MTNLLGKNIKKKVCEVQKLWINKNSEQQNKPRKIEKNTNLFLKRFQNYPDRIGKFRKKTFANNYVFWEKASDYN